jgi:hypothetical protein
MNDLTTSEQTAERQKIAIMDVLFKWFQGDGEYVQALDPVAAKLVANDILKALGTKEKTQDE